MNETKKTTPSKEGQVVLETLQKAVDKTLERKKRIGQYAVIWRDGKPVMTGADASQKNTERQE